MILEVAVSETGPTCFIVIVYSFCGIKTIKTVRRYDV